MELHQLMEMGEVVTTTFGPLDKYIAANDNVPQPFDESGASPGFGVGPTVHNPAAASIRGLTGSGKPYLYSVAELVEMEEETAPLHSLDDIAKLPGFIYLGSPYAKYHAGMDEAARVVAECAGKLMARGMRIYCPIAHGHAVTRHHELPRTWDYWKDQDQPLINAASALIVLEMAGWWDSVGLKYEFESFLTGGKPIVYLEPSDLGVLEPKLGMTP
jgi:hypothetical protein